MASCNHDCSSCGESCSERDLRAPANAHSSIKKVIAVVSGKGGVGKSTVTASLAVAMSRRGKKVAVLDADITGPSIPTAFGIHDHATGTEDGINPAVTQFWTDVHWGDVDYMFVDLPPGTGDVPLTVFQSLPVDGVVIVTSPQDLVSMIVAKAVKMANMMNIPVLGFVENYSYLQCPDCGKKISVFGKSHIDEIAAQFNLPVLAKLPIDPTVAESFDNGLMETVDTADMAGVIEAIQAL